LVYLKDFLSLLWRRAVGTVLVLLGTIVIIFLISHALSPDPARLWAGPRAHAATVAAVALRYHLNDPLYTQFFYFFRDIVTGNLGIDPATGQSITSEIAVYLPNTLELVFASFVIVVILGISLGYIAAMHFSTKTDSIIRITYLLSWSTPTYLAAILAILIFATYIPILPSGGLYSLTIGAPKPVTGFFLIDSLLSLNFADFVSGVQHLILPAAALAFLNFGIISRVVRSSILNVRWSTHVKSAKARGLSENQVRFRHILRNALIDATSVSAVMFGWLLTGTVVVEQIFAWPGIGQFADQAVLADNYPALIPVVIVFAVGVIVANFIADVSYSLLDPRIRMGTEVGAVG